VNRMGRRRPRAQEVQVSQLDATVRCLPKRKAFRLLLVVIVLALALCAACARSQGERRSYTVGETADIEGWSVTVNGFHQLPSDAFIHPDPGHAYCAILLTVRNQSSGVRYVMYERQMTLVDSDGKQAPHPAAGVAAARTGGWLPPDGSFVPGEAMSGAVSYQVDSAVDHALWQFRTGLLPWSGEVTFDLGKPTPLP
jgi:hypothetical protein